MYLLQLKTKLYSLFLRSCSYEKYKFYVNYNYVKVLGKHVCVYILHRQWDYCSFSYFDNTQLLVLYSEITIMLVFVPFIFYVCFLLFVFVFCYFYYLCFCFVFFVFVLFCFVCLFFLFCLTCLFVCFFFFVCFICFCLFFLFCLFLILFFVWLLFLFPFWEEGQMLINSTFECCKNIDDMVPNSEESHV